tara:strand:- start:74 stop:232 length:159 start_codon:yes stop_codon:yes gene_type:complete
MPAAQYVSIPHNWQEPSVSLKYEGLQMQSSAEDDCAGDAEFGVHAYIAWSKQ